jgi:sugar transferase (PEP-CTERM system associated)
MIRALRAVVPASIFVLLLSEIILVFFCYTLAAYLTLDVDPYFFLMEENGLLRTGFALASILLGLYFLDLYTNVHIRSEVALLSWLSQVMGIAFIVQALLSYVDRNLILPRWVMLIGSSFCLVALFLWRLVYGFYVVRRLGTQRVLLLGTNPVIQEIAEAAGQRPELSLTIAGYVDDVPPDEPLRGGKLLGGLKDFRQIVAAVKPDLIVVGMSERRARLPVYDLLELRFSGIHIEEAGSSFEANCQRISTKELRPSQLIFSGELGPRHSSVMAQTIYSALIALAGAILFLPLMLLVALAVKVTSKGPALFRQTRVGLGGKLFTLYKFRSMATDAEALTGPVWASQDDPRVTPLGRLLRRARLDELPQFFNVLRGEMSIVGPRPERPEFVQALSEQIPYYRQRLCVKPGITGWAQINHKYADTLEDTVKKLEYDLYYIKNLSPSLDAYIIFNTLKTMLLTRGAR